MTMQFRTVKTAIIDTLAAAAAGRFRTIGHQSQTQDAETIKGFNRSVRVYFGRGSFPKNSASLNGPVQHDVNFSVELQVAEPAKIDLSALSNPASTEAEKAVALAAASEADELADSSWDELADIVYQILMDAQNIDFGLANQVANRWINSISKDKIREQGSLLVVTGSIELGLRVEEQLLGDDTTTPLDTIDSSVLIEDQTTVEAGVTTTYP